MEMTELEFKIYSNALVEIGKIIGSNDKTLDSIRYGENSLCKLAIQSYLGSGCPFDFIVFERKYQRFIEIEYHYTNSDDELEVRKIQIPEYLGNVEYV